MHHSFVCVSAQNLVAKWTGGWKSCLSFTTLLNIDLADSMVMLMGSAGGRHSVQTVL